MEIKYRSGYAEGGFLDDGANIDPVSGNEVPTGSLAEEVRDDIPAQLSEGEFVVPADVVRFIGLDKLMKMRESAKAGLANMEAEGQMGGSPAEAPMEEMPMMESDIDIDSMIDGMEDEGAMPAFAEGGFVQREDGSWSYNEASEEEEGSSYSDLMGNNFGSVPTTDTMTYVNADGHKIYIPVIDGKPAYTPPEGYTLVETEAVVDDGIDDSASEDLGAVYNQASNDSPRQSDQQKADRARDIVTSNGLQRDHTSKITDMAGYDMTQEQSNAMFAALTPQAREIYNSRFKDEAERGFLDGFMAKGKSPADLMIVAQKTANSLNNQRGIIDYDPNATHTPDPGALAKGLGFLAKGVFLGPLGLIGEGVDALSGDEKSEAKSLLTSLKGVITTAGEPSPFGNSDEKGNQPTGPADKVYNQAYWAKKLQDGVSQEDMFKEQQALASSTGKNPYGHAITSVDPNSASEQIAAKLRAEKEKENTIREMDQQRKYQESIDKRDSERDAERLARSKAFAASKAAADAEAASKAAAAAAAAAAESQKRRQDSQTNTGGGSDNSSSQPKAYKQYSQKAAKAKKAAESGTGYAGGQYGLAKGGLVGKEPIKKMRSDNTTGLAAKKKSKAKAQAKKGALAAKRT